MLFSQFVAIIMIPLESVVMYRRIVICWLLILKRVVY